MLLLILNVIYVLLAIAMIALILMQRGAGAQAGSGFGGGASATVFGSRGASNFMSKSTKWLAIAFFVISLFMAWYATHNSPKGPVQQDLGVMAQLPAPAPAKAGTNGGSVPTAPALQAPATTAPAVSQPDQSVPLAPAPAASGTHAPPATPPAPASGG
jgi:preprotein translocase subunit SecG